MDRFRLAALVLLPSGFSLVATVIGALAVLVVAAWVHITGTLIVDHELFAGQLTAMDLLSAGPVIYNALIVVGSLTVGLVVYFALLGIHRVATRASTGWHEVFKADPRIKAALELEFGVRMFVRLLMLSTWAAYCLIFAKVIFPTCMYALQIGLERLQEPSEWGYGLFAFALLALGLHIHIVFARLFSLRPRLFGGTAVDALYAA